MNEIASETYCAANHPDYYWPPAESVEAYKNLNFNFVIFQYDNGRFMAASADAKGIYADGKSCEEALEDLRTAIECRVFVNKVEFTVEQVMKKIKMTTSMI
jgi:hypothetical protein